MQQQAPVDVGDTRWLYVAEILYMTAGVGFLFPLLKQYKSYILFFFLMETFSPSFLQVYSLFLGEE